MTHPSDPLYIFSPDSPIQPRLMHHMLNLTLAAMPAYAAGSAAEQAELRLVAMHQVAALNPEDRLEAMLAMQYVALQAQMLECLRLAALPGVEPAEARRDRAQANALSRSMDALLKRLQKAQALRIKAADIPSEKAGYWFHDLTVHAPAADAEVLRWQAEAAVAPEGKRTDAGEAVAGLPGVKPGRLGAGDAAPASAGILRAVRDPAGGARVPV